VEKHHFNTVTLLITHYNRSKSLEHLLRRCQEERLAFKEIIVSDDGSRETHLIELRALMVEYSFRLIESSTNKGLGNNINKGQDAVKTPYTLYVQEDFEPTSEFVNNFTNAIKLMDEEDWDLIRFYTFPWAPFPYLKPYKMGYSQMLFRPQLRYLNHLKFRIYSDHPHLRRSNFLERFGRYVEDKPGDPTEYGMCLQFIQAKGKALLFDGPDLFLHENMAIEPNTMVRSKWKLETNFMIQLLRMLYLKAKVINTTVRLKIPLKDL
jgi:glycosyltransferase involved in cell wall biosynthesis